MCGISGIVGPNWEQSKLFTLVNALRHRGPDDTGTYLRPAGNVGLGHNRLSIIDLSVAGHQPMVSHDGRLWIVYNGEIYNYVELREELKDYPYKSNSDTEVILAAYEKWGTGCLHRFVGMFAIAIWDERHQSLFAARDRFGVKPFYYHIDPHKNFTFASEIKALHAAGIPRQPDSQVWATYLSQGLSDHGSHTFWEGITQLPPGSFIEWNLDGRYSITKWYDPAIVAKTVDDATEEQTCAWLQELLGLLHDTVRLRYRADVPVGICLSGGLDSSVLLALTRQLLGSDRLVNAFTFVSGDPRYDEDIWAMDVIATGKQHWHKSSLAVSDIPELALRVQRFQDEPYGGIPTLGMATVHAEAQANGVKVLLDGNGVDEAWGGYDYYSNNHAASTGLIQGVNGSRTRRPDWLAPELASMSAPHEFPQPFKDPLRNLQYRDICYSKLPKALRFNDRVSMMHSRELREPFLDHRIVELGLGLPRQVKLSNGRGKWLVREAAGQLIPAKTTEAAKRPVQTPQREWLRTTLADWATDMIEAGLSGWGSQWLAADHVRREWQHYRDSGGDSSFHVWQWLSIGMMQYA